MDGDLAKRVKPIPGMSVKIPKEGAEERRKGRLRTATLVRLIVS